jgi:hypothetical protein
MTIPQKRTDPMKEEQQLTEKIAQGHDAELVDAALREQLGKRRQHIEEGIFQHLRGDEALSPEKAVQAWLELHAVHRLEQHLRKRIQVGEAAGERLRTRIESPDGDRPQPLTRRRFRNA